ncbi:NodT family efflux transporter outer membrane factor (OMF) lipoprotein [Duganella sp. SG902]|uniref:efflux transporter outer membrane subunit n=1 Tax=Duganella sp. SG902 TaxID=2587016 RepID=UPI00159D98EC|nr:efflux transporter outer membrane subunit [Duganella sp. SG902]NVM77524.1 NodT family efflux transporter outer membrane factor (OMF) lipoprotein [Duganella sp. SG902]
MALDFTRCARSRRTAALLALLWGALTSGCALAPAWRQPAYAIPSTLGADATQAPVAPATAELSHAERRFLLDFAPGADLPSLIQRVLRHNSDYQLALLQVEQARAAYAIVSAARLPTIGAQLQNQRLHFNNPGLQERYQQSVANAGLGIDNYELDFFGKLESQSEAARQRFLASDAGREAARGALIAEALRAYVLEVSATQLYDEYQAINADSAALLTIAQQQAAIGLLSHDDLDRSRAQAGRAAAASLQAAERMRAAHRALQILAGYDLAPVGGALAPMAGAASLPPAWRELSSSILLQRPEIRQAEAELRAAHADIGAARAAFFPSIQLSTAIGGASDALHSLFTGGRGFWSFTPRLTLPIFDYGQRRANLDLAWTRRQAGVVQYEQAIEAAFRQVADALGAHTAWRAAELQLRAQSKDAARRMARTRARSEQGLQDRPQLLSERIEATQLAVELTEAQQHLALTRVALFHAFYGTPISSD